MGVLIALGLILIDLPISRGEGVTTLLVGFHYLDGQLSGIQT
ncbi:hypothetical protein PMIT1303_00830 [Prochlorococcus sp. MIT 1303]|nr:hypothetical protein PMIT1303_00830 [Prochlorococcus sp. MIT 1303]